MRTILGAMSVAEMPFGSTEMRADPGKRLMLFSGRANRVLAASQSDRRAAAYIISSSARLARNSKR